MAKFIYCSEIQPKSSVLGFVNLDAVISIENDFINGDRIISFLIGPTLNDVIVWKYKDFDLGAEDWNKIEGYIKKNSL